MLRHSRTKHVRKNFSHAPQNVDHTPIKSVLEGSWLTKKAVLAKKRQETAILGANFRGQ